MKKLLDADGGVISEFHYDEMEDRTYVRNVQDVEPILENNKRLQGMGDGWSSDRFLRRIASIPLVVAQQWMKEDGVNWMALPKKEKSVYLRKKLTDPQWRYLRTSDGNY